MLNLELLLTLHHSERTHLYFSSVYGLQHNYFSPYIQQKLMNIGSCLLIKEVLRSYITLVCKSFFIERVSKGRIHGCNIKYI